MCIFVLSFPFFLACFLPCSLSLHILRPLSSSKKGASPSAYGVKTKAPINFHGYEEMGCKPIGWKALLDTTSLNNALHWLKAKEFFQMGILIAPRETSVSTIESRIATLEKFYPVVGGGKALGCAVHEGGVMRGLHVLGDDTDIAHFWALASEAAIAPRHLQTFDLRQRAFLWTAMTPHSVYVPYLDFDEKALSPDHFDRILAERIMPAISLVSSAIRKAASQENVNWQMFQNTRQLENGLIKFSFHVHFYEIGILNINVFKLMLSTLSELPRKLNWMFKNGQWFFEEDLKPIVDTGVYSGRKQLFRGPYCGKTGDVEAILKPVTVVPTEQNGYFIKEQDSKTTAEKEMFILRARIARNPVGLRMIDFVDAVPPHLAPLRSSTVYSEPLTRGRNENRILYDFFQPLMTSCILPAWQEFRYRDLVSQQAGGGATVPQGSLRIIKDEPHATKVGVRHLIIQGDTYCMIDPNHFHSQNPRTIGIIIDFVHCHIQQSCFACGRPSVKYCFLHLNNEIRIEEEKLSRFSCLNHFEHFRDPHQFLLDYYIDLFRYHKITEQVWVYDEEQRTWKTGAKGTRVVGVLIDRINTRYNAYINQKKHITVKAQLDAFSRANPTATQDEAEKFTLKTYEEARKFIEEHTNIIRLNAQQRGKVLDELKQYRVRQEVSVFNPQEFLLPMKNGNCLNVFNMETEEIRPNHYFTGLLNAEITECLLDIQDVEEWFLEIASGDQEKADYLKTIAGYCMTMSVHDRKMYVLKGTGKNGKGIFKQFLLIILDGPEGSESRWLSLKPQYWAQKGTSNENAEGASPSARKMLHKSVYYTDDMDRSLIDSCRCKRVVAGEPQDCRTLYGEPIQFRPQGKIIWTSNFVPDGPGNDSAWWERFVMIPMLAKYTPDKDKVNPRNFVILMNDVKVKNLLEKRDAFFTVCVRQLNKYYRSLPCDPQTNEPLELSSFPLPPSVQAANREARETQLPLASFIREYTVPCMEPLMQVTLPVLFHNYMIFLDNINERRMRQETTQTSFIRLLNTGLEINVHSDRVELRMKKPVVSLKESKETQNVLPFEPAVSPFARFVTGDAQVARPVRSGERKEEEGKFAFGMEPQRYYE